MEVSDGHNRDGLNFVTISDFKSCHDMLKIEKSGEKPLAYQIVFRLFNWEKIKTKQNELVYASITFDN